MANAGNQPEKSIAHTSSAELEVSLLSALLTVKWGFPSIYRALFLCLLRGEEHGKRVKGRKKWLLFSSTRLHHISEPLAGAWIALNGSGRPRHGEPLLSTRNHALSIVRWSRNGRPLPRCGGKSGSASVHCSSVSSYRRIRATLLNQDVRASGQLLRPSEHLRDRT